MKKKILIILLLVISGGVSLFAQEELPPPKNDSVTLRQFLLKGKFKAHIRTALFNTVNQGKLRDYTSLAIGAGLAYETPVYKGLQIGFSGYFIFDLASSDLSEPDPLTNQFSRYELGLFDLTDPKNKTNLDRLEELYIRYHFKKSSLTIGRQVLKTPFINPQDGRMRPTLEEAAWLQSKIINNITLQGGWIARISPRSTIEWYTIGKSIGVYSPGVDELGKPSAYAGNTLSRGIATGSITYEKDDGKLQVWDTWVQNVMNTLFIQADKKFSLGNDHKVITGIQIITQYQTGNGGNRDTSLQFYPDGNKALVISSRAGYEQEKIQFNLNYTRISKAGRYLMPREWGVDPFYTFMPRERNEGYGNVNAVNANFLYRPGNKQWELKFGYGHYYLPDTKDFEFNKYGTPSYRQVNIQVNHSFTGFLEGLDMNLLLVYKGKMGNSYNNLKYIDNKVNLLHSSVTFNYHF